MRKKIVHVSSDSQSMAIRAVNGIFVLQESWMTKRIRDKKTIKQKK